MCVRAFMCHFAVPDDQQMARDWVGLATDDSRRSMTNRCEIQIPQNDFDLAEHYHRGGQDFFSAYMLKRAIAKGYPVCLSVTLIINS